MKNVSRLWLRLTVVVFLLIVLVTGSATETAEETDGSPAPRGFIWYEGNGLEHKASGAVFAKNYSIFTRSGSDPVLYDPTGKDVSLEYTFGVNLGIANIYIYPAPESISDEVLLTEYQLRVRDVAVDKGPLVIKQSQWGHLDTASGQRTIFFSDFTFESGITWYSFLALLGKGEWFILYRVSVPESLVTEEIVAAIIKLPREFDYSVIR